MELSKELIDKINKECPSDQGIFKEPYGIPVHIKEPVVYLRYETGGWSGGGYMDECVASPYEVNKIPNFEVLDILLNEIYPNISYLDYKKISKIIHTNEETENEYYGNSTDYHIDYIILSELLKLLEL